MHTKRGASPLCDVFVRVNCMSRQNFLNTDGTHNARVNIVVLFARHFHIYATEHFDQRSTFLSTHPGSPTLHLSLYL